MVRMADDFTASALDAYWTPWAVGTGNVQYGDGRVRFALPSATAQQYSNAQITDYHGRARRDYPWQPPLRMTACAWASHSQDTLKGTAGFGFWNQPFVPVGAQLPRLPRAVWFFFGSPPNNMALAKGVPGHGWKAATLDATRPLFWLLAPFAPPGFLLMRIPAVYRALWPVGQRAIGASEALLPVDLGEPHTYTLEWLPGAVIFSVDDRVIHRAPYAPRGPLGFIAWMDNQYAVVTPQGNFRFGVLATDTPQWLALDELTIESL